MDADGHSDNIFVERLWHSVKHEDVYLNGYANMGELMVGLASYMNFYNVERVHQSLGYATPDQVYRSGIGGGAIILDKFGAKTETKTTTTKAKSGQRRTAAYEAESTA
jgi:putative transposase